MGVIAHGQRIRSLPVEGRPWGAQKLRRNKWLATHVFRAEQGSEAVMTSSMRAIDIPADVTARGLWGPALRLILALTLGLFCLATVCGAVIVS
jgi:hypothetical protein